MLKALKTKHLAQNFIYFETLDSTNDYCKNNMASIPNLSCVYASNQINGKGRRGKTWENCSDSGIAMSFVIKNIAIERLNTLTLIIGLGIHRALTKLTHQLIGIKWPNDILINNKKICGILCESVFENGEFCAVCGIGVNVLQGKEFFESSALFFAGSLLTQTDLSFSPLTVASAIFNELEPMLAYFLSDGFVPYCEEYKASCVNIGKDVRVVYENKTITGTVSDIAQSGCLLIESGGEHFEIASGDVSVRGLYGYV